MTRILRESTMIRKSRNQDNLKILKILIQTKKWIGAQEPESWFRQKVGLRGRW